MSPLIHDIFKRLNRPLQRIPTTLIVVYHIHIQLLAYMSGGLEEL
jgi:hypothetical protein